MIREKAAKEKHKLSTITRQIVSCQNVIALTVRFEVGLDSS